MSVRVRVNVRACLFVCVSVFESAYVRVCDSVCERGVGL